MDTGADDVLGCVMQNPVEVFGYDPSKWSTPEAILTTLNDRTLWDIELTGQGFTFDQARLLLVFSLHFSSHDFSTAVMN